MYTKGVAGVYIIQSISKPERVYVGSSIHINKRWWVHKSELRKRVHSSTMLQNHVNKYGLEDLVFEVIESEEYVDRTHLLAREQGWFEHFSIGVTEKPYFNCFPAAGSPSGYKHSEEAKLKIGLKSKGNKNRVGHIPTSETRLKLHNANTGKVRSEEVRQRLSTALMGHVVSEETKEKLKQAHINHPELYGKPHSEETKLKLSIILSGRVRSEEHKKNISIANKGKKRKPLSEEARRKLSIAKTGKPRSLETRKKLSDSMQGRTPWNKGKKAPEKTIQALSAYRFSQRVINTITGEVFESMQKAADSINMNYGAFIAQLGGISSNRTNFKKI